jgi:hypothetical protein
VKYSSESRRDARRRQKIEIIHHRSARLDLCCNFKSWRIKNAGPICQAEIGKVQRAETTRHAASCLVGFVESEMMSGEKRRRGIQWDEQTIREHDQLRGTRKKIQEPKTPYRPPRDLSSAGSVGSVASDDSMNAGGGGLRLNDARLQAALSGAWDSGDESGEFTSLGALVDAASHPGGYKPRHNPVSYTHV